MTQPQTNTNTPVQATPLRGPENIKAMCAEIECMKAYCLTHYNAGYDTMVECWEDHDYEKLFYAGEFDPGARNLQIKPGFVITVRPRVPFTAAWERLHDLASIFAERQADARFHESQAQ